MPKKAKGEYQGVKQTREQGTATIRWLNQLMQDVDIIYNGCIDNVDGSDIDPSLSKLDEFQRTKRKLVELLKTIKIDMKTEDGLVERLGNRTTEAIKMRKQTTNNLDTARSLHAQLSVLLAKEQKPQGWQSDSVMYT